MEWLEVAGPRVRVPFAFAFLPEASASSQDRSRASHSRVPARTAVMPHGAMERASMPGVEKPQNENRCYRVVRLATAGAWR
jgi:hypothetical protein